MAEAKRIFSITIFLSLFLAMSDACAVQDSIPVVLQGDNSVQWEVISKDAVTPRLQVSVSTEGDFIAN